MAKLHLPIESDTTNPYELVGRWLATIVIIERTLEIIVESFLIRSISFADEPQRLFWRQHVASRLGFERKIQMIATIVKSLDDCPGECLDLAKRLHAVRDVRDHLAHRLLGASVEGLTVVTDAWGQERRRFSPAELATSKRETVETYNRAAGLATYLNRLNDARTP